MTLSQYNITCEITWNQVLMNNIKIKYTVHIVCKHIHLCKYIEKRKGWGIF